MTHYLTLSNILKRIAKDACEIAIADADYVFREGYSSPDVDYGDYYVKYIMLEHYEQLFQSKMALYKKSPLAPERLFVNGMDLHDEIKLIEFIIQILKTK